MRFVSLTRGEFRNPLSLKNTQYDNLNHSVFHIMRNRKAPTRINPLGAYIAFLLKRCLYVQKSLLSVAPYPKTLQRYEIIVIYASILAKIYVNVT